MIGRKGQAGGASFTITFKFTKVLGLRLVAEKPEGVGGEDEPHTSGKGQAGGFSKAAEGLGAPPRQQAKRSWGVTYGWKNAPLEKLKATSINFLR